MSLLKKMLGFTLGGVVSVLGLGSLLVGCDDSTEENGDDKTYSQAEHDCCDAASDFDSCIEDYRKAGKCGGNEVIAYYGPAACVDIGDATKEEYNACKDEFDKCDQKEFDQCIKDYRKGGEVDVLPAYYGPAPCIEIGEVTQEEYNACQEAFSQCDQEGFDKCIQDLRDTGKPGDDEIVAGYGPCVNYPDMTDDERACCQKYMNTCDQDGLDACVEDYRKTNRCGSIDATVYGMPACDVDTKGVSAEAMKCCEAYAKDSDVCDQGKFDKCIEKFETAGECGPGVSTDPVPGEPEEMI